MYEALFLSSYSIEKNTDTYFLLRCIAAPSFLYSVRFAKHDPENPFSGFCPENAAICMPYRFPAAAVLKQIHQKIRFQQNLIILPLYIRISMMVGYNP